MFIKFGKFLINTIVPLKFMQNALMSHLKKPERHCAFRKMRDKNQP